MKFPHVWPEFCKKHLGGSGVLLRPLPCQQSFSHWTKKHLLNNRLLLDTASTIKECQNIRHEPNYRKQNHHTSNSSPPHPNLRFNFGWSYWHLRYSCVFPSKSRPKIRFLFFSEQLWLLLLHGGHCPFLLGDHCWLVAAQWPTESCRGSITSMVGLYLLGSPCRWPCSMVEESEFSTCNKFNKSK